MPKTTKIALLSVSDKEGVLPFAKGLLRLGYRIVSTGNTAKLLAAAKIPVSDISDFTGFPEILGGRVKTLHPKVFGGLLADSSAAHKQDLVRHEIERIDLVCVNLYPFAETVAKEGVTLEEAIEQIDIGGVSLLRAAAKNFMEVVVVNKPKQYAEVLEKLKKGEVDAAYRRQLAASAFATVTRYDGLITSFIAGEAYFTPIFEKVKRLRYGENPHQEAILYAKPSETGIVSAQVLQGKELSYNNLVDAEVAMDLVYDFEKPTCAVIKHACPCGVAVREELETALTEALAADPISPFGGIIAVNRPFTTACAKQVADMFLELIIAPSFDAGAVKILSKKPNLRLLAVGADFKPSATEIKKISGGLLVQTRDSSIVQKKDMKLVTKKAVSAREAADLLFAARVVKHVKSNAIVLARDGVAVGIGAGQTSRVDAVEIAIRKAGTRASGSVLASDAFFPFADSIAAAHRAGITAIVQPGGSVRDAEVIAAANAANIGMVVTGVRSFRH